MQTKPKIIFAKQGDCADFRNLKAEVEKQKAKKNQEKPKEIPKPKIKKKGKAIAVYKSFNGVQVFIARVYEQEQAEALRALVEKLKNEYAGDSKSFRELIRANCEFSF